MKSLHNYFVIVANYLLLSAIGAKDTPVYSFRQIRTISQINCDNIEANDPTLESIIVSSNKLDVLNFITKNGCMENLITGNFIESSLAAIDVVDQFLPEVNLDDLSFEFQSGLIQYMGSLG